MKLTAENVNSLFLSCLFKDEEISGDGVPVVEYVVSEGVIVSVGLHKERVLAAKDTIILLAKQLPESFCTEGDSFLRLCTSREEPDDVWCQHRTADEMVMLMLAAGIAEYNLTRAFWPSLPGGVPYIKINLPEEASGV